MNMSERIDRIAASKLDGYLAGVTSFSGNSRDYTGGCFVVDVEAGASIGDAISQRFSWRGPFDFAESRVLPGGRRDLELEIRPYLVRDARGLSPEEVEDLQHYLSFRVMDMLEDALGGAAVDQVLRLDVAPSPGSSDVTFFAVDAGAEALVLQFNNNIPFKRTVEAGVTTHDLG